MKVNPTTYPISWLRDRNIDGSLVIQPPYQRKPVWTKDQKTFLIDSIIKKYHIPEIYIHRVTSASGENTYNIIDGQQRIRAILEFINDDFALSDKYSPEYIDRSFSDLPEDIKAGIWGYTIYAREISEATENDVREMFKRMNKNVVSLNPQELRHATFSGEFIKLMEEIADDPFWTENKIVTPNEVRRMTDVQFVSEIYISIINGIQDKAKDLEKYYILYEERPPELEYKERFNTIKQFISLIFPDIRDTRWRNKPDLYTLFLALNRCLGKNKSFTVTGREISKMKSALTSFAEKVDTLIDDSSKKHDRKTKEYVNAVIKSTTDKQRRLTRDRIVYEIISPFFK